MLVADHLEPCTADAQHGEPRSAQSQPDPHHLNVRSIGMRTRISVRPLLRPRRDPIPVRFRCVKRQDCFLPPRLAFLFFSLGPKRTYVDAEPQAARGGGSAEGREAGRSRVSPGISYLSALPLLCVTLARPPKFVDSVHSGVKKGLQTRAAPGPVAPRCLHCSQPKTDNPCALNATA